MYNIISRSCYRVNPDVPRGPQKNEAPSARCREGRVDLRTLLRLLFFQALDDGSEGVAGLVRDLRCAEGCLFRGRFVLEELLDDIRRLAGVLRERLDEDRRATERRGFTPLRPLALVQVRNQLVHREDRVVQVVDPGHLVAELLA